MFKVVSGQDANYIGVIDTIGDPMQCVTVTASDIIRSPSFMKKSYDKGSTECFSQQVLRLGFKFLVEEPKTHDAFN